MSAREKILRRVANAAAAGRPDDERRRAVEARLRDTPSGVVPQRGQLEPKQRLALFVNKAQEVQATVVQVKSRADVPKTVAAYLRAHNLPASVRMGADRRLAAMPWDKQRALELKSGASDGDDAAGVSHAFAGVAETGTLVLTSGAANPTTVNFLPEHHIVVIDAADIAGDLEAVLKRLRKKHGKGTMPRNVNLITGPSRSGDVEQKIILGAHGPRALHIVVVGAAK